LISSAFSLIFCCFQQVFDTHSHLLSCLHFTLICLRLNLSTVYNFSLPSYHAITPSFSYPDYPCLTFPRPAELKSDLNNFENNFFYSKYYFLSRDAFVRTKRRAIAMMLVSLSLSFCLSVCPGRACIVIIRCTLART